MKNKKSFIMYTDYQKHINLLSDEEAGKLIKAVLEYTNTSNEPKLPPAAYMAFSFIKEQIDRDLEKWEDTCKKRSEAGKLGGRPKIHKDSGSEQKQLKAKKAIGFFENQNEAKKADNVNVNDSDNVSDSEYVNETVNDIDTVNEYVSESENKNDIDIVSDSEYVNNTINEFEEIYDPFNNNTDSTDCTKQNKNNLYSQTDTDYTNCTDCNTNINNITNENTDNTDNAYRKECIEQCLQNSIDNMNKFYEMQNANKKLEPKREEVFAFAEAHNAVEYADKFYGYYSRHGWQTKNGEKISDWREAFLRWKQREKPMSPLQNATQNNMQNMMQNNMQNIPKEYSSLAFSESPFPMENNSYSDSDNNDVINESSKKKALDMLNSYLI